MGLVNTAGEIKAPNQGNMPGPPSVHAHAFRATAPPMSHKRVHARTLAAEGAGVSQTNPQRDSLAESGVSAVALAGLSNGKPVSGRGTPCSKRPTV